MPEDWELEKIKEKKLRKLFREAEGGVEGAVIERPIQVDEERFEEVLRKYEFVLVDFWAEWCGPCRMLAPIIDELAKEYAGRVVFVKVDVDRARRLAERFGIMSVPTLIFFRNGKPIDVVVGWHPKPVLEEFINQYLQ
ncbi:MAG: thioredoxin [Nitrososphaeria archaeon]|nr:thioredoxin [Aigarchaeota archaeon]MCX8187051.1 thioredoxin [Nitrososphaeria archaeon]MDW8021628.1 thioredoxin [Nitrososphaerota archaeon]